MSNIRVNLVSLCGLSTIHTFLSLVDLWGFNENFRSFEEDGWWLWCWCFIADYTWMNFSMNPFIAGEYCVFNSPACSCLLFSICVFFTWLFDSWRSLIKFEIILEKFLGILICCISLTVIKTSMLGSLSWNHIAIHLHFHLSSPSCHSFVPLLPCCSAFLSSFSIIFFLFECVCSLNSLS